jgi:hypothetical protein
MSDDRNTGENTTTRDSYREALIPLPLAALTKSLEYEKRRCTPPGSKREKTKAKWNPGDPQYDEMRENIRDINEEMMRREAVG